MDIEPLSLPDDGSAAGPSSQPALPSASTSRSNAISKSASAPRRQLRARPSDLSAPSSSPVTKKARTDKGAVPRQPTDKELAFVQSQLSEDGLKVRRDGVIRGKEMELKAVVDGHDDAVREKFHLERFISIVTGWDPKVSSESSGESVILTK
jgi:helicase SWR1